MGRFLLMNEKIEELINIINWYCTNANDLDPLDGLKGMDATMKYAEALRPLYEKYNKVEKEGFKILARIEK